MCVIPQSKKKDNKEVKEYICSCCGNSYTEQKGNFYHTKSELYKSNNNYSTICIPCLLKLFKNIETQTGSKRMALISICHLLDVYYSDKTFNNMMLKDNFSIGSYLNTFNGKQWAGKTFTTNLLQNDFAQGIEVNDENIPVNESPMDIKNRKYCISQLGYDPFEENSPIDRQFLFNALAEYLTDDVAEDPHRVKSVISMVRSILQESKIDALIDALLKTKSPNNDLLKSYYDAKEKVRKLINTTANDNGFTTKGARSSRGASTLTGIMREMLENNFEDAKVNIFDVKMNGVYRQIADISNKSLFDQLNYQTDDYARMVATQRDLIQKYEDEISKLQEELRLVKIENNKLKSAGGSR